MNTVIVNGIERAETAAEATARLALFAPAPVAVADYQNAIQQAVDAAAVAKQFNDGVTLASYANSTNAAWQAQATAFIAWRDNVWTYVYLQLAAVQAGQRSQPTVSAFLAELPAIVWPDV